MKKVLVVGGAGYIGSVVSNYFIDKKIELHSIDSLVNGYSRLIPKKVRFIKSDVANFNKISGVLKKNNFDMIIYLAAFTNLRESIKFKNKYINNNFKKFKKFIYLCSKYKQKNIIFSSTAAVYNQNKSGVHNEKSKIKSNNGYGYSKILCERFLINNFKKLKINFIILRYFNVAGSDIFLRSGPIYQKTVIKSIVQNFTKEKKFFHLYGESFNTPDGTAVRDFIHVMDLARIHFKAGKYLMKKKKNQIFNCGYGYGFSIRKLIDISEQIFNKKLNIKIYENKKGDLGKVISSNKKIKKILNWRPKYNSLKDILKSSYLWQKKLKNEK